MQNRGKGHVTGAKGKPVLALEVRRSAFDRQCKLNGTKILRKCLVNINMHPKIH